MFADNANLWLMLAVLCMGGVLSGLLYAYIGGTGVNRDHRKRIAELESAVDAVDSRIKKMNNRMSGELRQQTMTDKELKTAATLRLASGGGADESRPIPGGF